MRSGSSASSSPVPMSASARECLHGARRCLHESIFIVESSNTSASSLPTCATNRPSVTLTNRSDWDAFTGLFPMITKRSIHPRIWSRARPIPTSGERLRSQKRIVEGGKADLVSAVRKLRLMKSFSFGRFMPFGPWPLGKLDEKSVRSAIGAKDWFHDRLAFGRGIQGRGGLFPRWIQTFGQGGRQTRGPQLPCILFLSFE